MLEILFVIFLFRKLKTQTVKKNRSKWLPWIIPLFWFGGEFVFPFMIGIIYAILGKPIESNFIFYFYALSGGALGAGLAFLIVHLLPIKELNCPKCGWTFTKNSKFGVQCEECNSQLKVVDGKVSFLQKG